MDRLLQLGGDKKFLSYDDLNRELPENVVSPDDIEDVLQKLDASNIHVADSDERLIEQAAAIAAEDEEAVEDELELDLSAGALEKTNDPVRLYLRDHVSRLGLAPLTSMYFYGENQPNNGDDFRPEVHDSDGLLINFGSGEWLWRPIDNPRALHVSDFRASDIRGYGLIQRDREFELRNRIGQGQAHRRGAHHQEYVDRERAEPAAREDPLFGTGGRRDQGRDQRLEEPSGARRSGRGGSEEGRESRLIGNGHAV